MKKRICFVVAIPGTAQAFLRDHIQALSEIYDVYLVANIKCAEDVKGLALAGWHHINIERRISPWSDIKAVWEMFIYMKRMKFDAVHSVTPKAGLVTGLAARLCGIKHRIHIFTGQYWASRNGLMNWLTKGVDKMIIALDNHILVDGKSQRTFLVQEGLLHEGQAVVFGAGSICGVNAERFAPNPQVRIKLREEIGIKDNVLTFIFLGRLNHDKGIGEIYEAFNRLAREVKDVFLLFVGADEEGYLNRLPSYKNIITGENFFFYGHTPQPEDVLNAGDVFVLPTYREGFGSSVIEAACVGLPSICSDAYGVQDAYVENETGLKCRVGDVESLYQCMRRFYDNPELKGLMGANSRKRALKEFNGKEITNYWVNYYKELLS